ncbi:MAG: hypothetical protein JKY65_14655 [Planctomycetes bacterium]|nr:hypothetical protein [Planctomycetota bacterium]
MKPPVTPGDSWPAPRGSTLHSVPACLQAGMDGFLTKPARLLDLRRTLLETPSLGVRGISAP